MDNSKNPLLALQNGSDIRGVALAVPNGAPVNLTPQAVQCIAAAFVRDLAAAAGKPAGALRVGVGHDSRVTAQTLKAAALQGIATQGAQGFDCGLASTPAMFCATRYPQTEFDGAIMLTASHLPMERNGLKLFNKAGGYDKPDIKRVLTLAEAIAPAAPSAGEKAPETTPLLQYYCEDLCERIRREVNAADYAHPLAGLRVVVDAGNGAGGFFVDGVLAPLGADTAGSCFLEPDGHFPNHIPNPENRQAMEAVRAATLAAKADLGLIFDTDVDRMSAVLPDGSEVNRDAIIAMMAAIIAPAHPGGTIVTDSVTSHRLTAFLEDELGLRHRRFKRGYKNVINEGLRLNAEGVDAPLAIETSGHGAFRENFFLDDGAFMAVRLLVAAARAKAAGKPLGDLIAALPPCCEETERRIPIAGDDFAATGAAVLEAFEQRARQQGYTVEESCEGVRLRFAEGWALLRLSLHDPLLPLNVEGEHPGDCALLMGRVRALLGGFDALDLTALD